MDLISYEEFGVNFVHHAVTPERLAAAIAAGAGDTIRFGPTTTGPGGVAQVSAVGRIGSIHVDRAAGELLRYVATMPIDLDLEIVLAGVPNRFRGRVDVDLNVTVRTAAPLTLLLQMQEVPESDVRVVLEAGSVGAGVLQRVGNVDDEVRRAVTRDVNRRVLSERARAARTIDVAALVRAAIDR